MSAAVTTTFASSSGATSYIPLKDTSQVLSTVESEFVRSCAFRSGTVCRLDGRHGQELRPTRLVLTRSSGSSGGGSSSSSSSGGGGGGSTEAATATVQWGSGTRVTCTCQGELVPPSTDDQRLHGNEGVVQISVDLSPGASTTFRQAAPVVTAGTAAGGGGGSAMDTEQKLLSNRILRCIERILLLGGALDLEALCVQPGQWVWKLSLAVTVLDAAGGNLLDASVLASMAALRHYRKPHVQMMDHSNVDGSSSSSSVTTTTTTPTLIPSDWKEATPLPLHHTPLSVSFALFEKNSTQHPESSSNNNVAILVDPDAREELVMNGVLTLAMNVHGELLLLDFGGGCELSCGGSSSSSGGGSGHSVGSSSDRHSQLRQCHDLAAKLIPQLCRQLEESLTAADQQAREERLQRLQRQQQQQQSQQQQQQQQLANFVLPPLAPLPPLPLQSAVVEGAPVELPPPLHMAAQNEQLIAPYEDEQVSQKSREERQKAETLAEEAYRRQALDYNLGHAPVKVREDNEDDMDHNDSKTASNKSRRRQQQQSKTATNTLLAFMLESVRQQQEQQDESVSVSKPDGPAIPSKVATSISSKALPQVDRDDPMIIGATEEDKFKEPLPARKPPQARVHPSSSQPPQQQQQEQQLHDGKLDSDEEDATMQLETEYNTTNSVTLPPATAVSAAPTQSDKKNEVVENIGGDDVDMDDDVDDLAAAIKKKKKKKTKKK